MKKLLLILSLVFLFNSCTKTESELTDDQLIDAIIESEERISVAINDLPNTAIASLDVIMPNDVVSSAELAPKLGLVKKIKMDGAIKRT